MLRRPMELIARAARKAGAILGKPIVVRHPKEVAMLDAFVAQEQAAAAAFNAERAKRSAAALEQLGLRNGYAAGRIEKRQDGSYVVHKG